MSFEPFFFNGRYDMISTFWSLDSWFDRYPRFMFYIDLIVY